jgi:predicted alpha/beta-hydrolase family hydrolase
MSSVEDRTEGLRFDMDGRTLSALWTAAPDARAVALVAHGAGNDMRNAFLGGVADGLASNGVSVMRFNFPFTEEGRRSPDRAPVLMETWRAALEEAGRRAGRLPLVASGKSLGGRMASMLAAEMGGGFPPAALVFFGYPLHSPGKPEQLRDAHLSAIRIPMLFVQGTADALGRFDLVQSLVERLGAPARLHVVEGGDHSFRVRGARRPDGEIGQELGTVAADFIRQVVD